MNNLKSIRSLKKVVYKSRMYTLKRFVVLMIVGGMLLSLLYFGKYTYFQYAVSKAHIVLNYPEIENSSYPDGSRFAYYDFVSDDKIEAALEKMHNQGKYLNFGVEDVKYEFDVYSYLDDSASAEVSSRRSEGNDFSYVANEYYIKFIQPHDYKNVNFIEKIYSPDYSDEFLKALVEVNRKYFAETKGGMEGFEKLTQLDNTVADYDYSEKAGVYRTQINAIISYLGVMEKKNPEFKSEVYNMTIKDLKGKYEILVSNKLSGIDDFIESSTITKDKEIAQNKTAINHENNTLKLKQYSDKVIINDYAMRNYDHTFTENLINVVRDETQGLYQARPKTSFDTVVAQKNDAEESVAEYTEEVRILEEEMAKYMSSPEANSEQKRLKDKTETLFKNFEKEYNEVTKLSRKVLSEYLNTTNKGFLTAKVKKTNLISTSLIMKLGIMFVLGALIVFILKVLKSVISDAMFLRKKEKLAAEIKESGGWKGAR